MARKCVLEYGMIFYASDDDKEYEGKYELTQEDIYNKFKNLLIVKDGVVQNKTGG